MRHYKVHRAMMPKTKGLQVCSLGDVSARLLHDKTLRNGATMEARISFLVWLTGEHCHPSRDRFSDSLQSNAENVNTW